LVVSDEDQVAFDDLSTSLRMLVRLEYGLKCTVEPMETLEELLRRVTTRILDVDEYVRKKAPELPEDVVFDLCLVVRENPRGNGNE